ncbi:hypothetical protein UDX32_12755 [Serratia marcescens]|uniref:hypothetical protein n=1 Tax=Serratia marcescens TaxID=615 RepID=UPI000C13C6A8|nr:hypothetical protein [Serratia marcescens]PHY69697.1 hypothetical protein CS366_09005 [Serratia marcescens]PIC09878.1 hypothetical protein CS367_18150 [Serratia marcescens]CAI2062868.1 Uncharacterised protein [Serratia marcescens]HAT2880186.1 hypothetical protein [Serratia marcescens]HAT2891440.1 hypothetical protein [Serratia marcescens]
MVVFSLLENALDSVETGLMYFRRAHESQERRDYKQCLLNLFQATELLLKAAVSRRGAGLIFKPDSLKKHCTDPQTPTQKELYRCISVNVRELCKLVEKHYPSAFTSQGLEMVGNVAQLRNNLQHFTLEIDPQHLVMQLSSLYRLVFRPAFILLQEDEAEDSWNSAFRRQFITLETQFLEITTHQEYELARCPVCGSWSHFIVYDGESFPISSHCICCNFTLTELQVWEFQICPDCGWPSVIYVPEYKAGACLAHTCTYSKEEGFVQMEPCQGCGGYRLEDHCRECDPEE